MNLCFSGGNGGSQVAAGQGVRVAAEPFQQGAGAADSAPPERDRAAAENERGGRAAPAQGHHDAAGGRSKGVRGAQEKRVQDQQRALAAPNGRRGHP